MENIFMVINGAINSAKYSYETTPELSEVSMAFIDSFCYQYKLEDAKSLLQVAVLDFLLKHKDGGHFKAQVSNKTFELYYGAEAVGVIPDYRFDEHSFLQEEYLNYVEEADDYICDFDNFVVSHSYDKDLIVDGFAEFLKEFVGDRFIYDYSGLGHVACVDVDDQASLEDFIRELNKWTTHGYCYTNDFNFEGKNVIGIVPDFEVEEGLLDTPFAKYLQKWVLLDMKYEGYSFEEFSQNDQLSIVQDWFWHSIPAFFSLYAENYLYGKEAIEINFDDFTQEEKDLSECVVAEMFEVTHPKMKDFKQQYLQAEVVA